MTDLDIGQPPQVWLDVVRRTQLSRTVHSVAMTLATYADWKTGRDIHPGIARLAVDCKLGYKVVKSALAELRRVGLIELVAAAPRRDWADDYRLIFHPDLAERVEILSPSEHRNRVNSVRLANRGKYTPKNLRGTRNPADANLRGTRNPADERLRGTGSPAEPDVETTEISTDRATEWDAETSSAGFGVTADFRSAGFRDANLRGTAYPATNHVPRPLKPTNQNGVEVEAAVTVTRARAPDETPIDPLPKKCAHGFAVKYRADGTSSCALCRRDANRPVTLAPVITIYPKESA